MAAKVGWWLGLILCLAIVAFGAFVCLFGVEALITGANVSAWVGSLVLLVVLPLAGSIFCVIKLASGSRGDHHAFPPAQRSLP